MKIGDLVIMPGETLAHGRKQSVGLVIADDYDAKIRHTGRTKRSRIGVLWSDGDGCIDYEPISWLEVISC